MPKKEDKGNGGNDGEKGKERRPVGFVLPEDPVQKQKRILEEKRGQYLFLKLASLLEIIPRECIGKPKSKDFRWMFFTFGNQLYDFTEMLEKVIEKIEEIESKTSKK